MAYRLIALLSVLTGALLLSAQQQPGALAPAYQSGFDAHLGMLKEIRDEMRALRVELRSGIGGGQTVSFESAARNRCVSCHAANQADDKGGGFAMFDEQSKLIDFRPLERRRIAEKVRKGEMPPGQPLSAEEKKLFEPSIVQGVRK